MKMKSWKGQEDPRKLREDKTLHPKRTQDQIGEGKWNQEKPAAAAVGEAWGEAQDQICGREGQKTGLHVFSMLLVFCPEV